MRFFNRNYELIDVIAKAFEHQYQRELIKLCKSHHLSLTQFVICDRLQNGVVSQSEIVRLTGVDRSTVSEVMQRLLKQGYIRRERNADDTRAWVLHLTLAGLSATQHAAVAYKRADTRLFARLGKHQPAFVRSLRRLTAALENEAIADIIPVAAKPAGSQKAAMNV
jgi:DNA-binding MarR family transcriptional regulator